MVASTRKRSTPTKVLKRDKVVESPTKCAGDMRSIFLALGSCGCVYRNVWKFGETCGASVCNARKEGSVAYPGGTQCTAQRAELDSQFIKMNQQQLLKHR
eukprot:scaffold19644_cov63-Phaeocystis_antarctica.AAC.4